MKKIIARDTHQLKGLIKYHMTNYGDNCNLMHIDVSQVTDMSKLFRNSKFNGDISNWDVSNVTNMHAMFSSSNFNGDIRNWDVSNVEDMSLMFHTSVFNQDLSKWNTESVKDIHRMFCSSKFNGDLSLWDVSRVEDMSYMFYSSIFDSDISNWQLNSIKNMRCLFNSSSFSKSIKSWEIPENTNVYSFATNFKGTLPDSLLNRLDEVFIYARDIDKYLNRHKDQELNLTHVKRCLSVNKRPTYTTIENFKEIKEQQKLCINLGIPKENMAAYIYTAIKSKVDVSATPEFSFN